MHLTTIVSLLGVGAAAAPAFKSLALNTRIPMPTPDPSSPSDETLQEIPNLGLRRRQEAESAYPPGMPAEIDADSLGTLVDLFETSTARFADRSSPT